MNRCDSRVIAIFLVLIIQLPLAAQADHVRIRTFIGMEPYGRISSRHWGSENATEVWNASYGFLPGIETYWMMNDRVEIGAGFQWMFSRRVFRDGGVDGETFSLIPIYAATRINLMEVKGIDTYAAVRLGYTLFRESAEFRDIWSTEPGGALTSTTGGMYGSAAIGVKMNIFELPSAGLDFSMDAGYAFYGASGTNSTGKVFPLSYQAMLVDFALDWRL